MCGDDVFYQSTSREYHAKQDLFVISSIESEWLQKHLVYVSTKFYFSVPKVLILARISRYLYVFCCIQGGSKKLYNIAKIL